MKRKMLPILLSSAMIAAALSGCSSKTPETEKQTEAKTEAQTEAQTEAATEAAEEEEAVTEAAAEEEEAVTEAAAEEEAVTEAAAEEEAVTEAAEEEEAVTEAAAEEEAVTEAAEEEEAVTEAAAEEEEAVTEAAEEEEAVTEAAEEEEAVTEAAEEAEEVSGITYTASAAGISSDVTVTAVFDGDKLVDVQIDVSGETAGIGAEIGDDMAQAILDAQSAEVDTVSGATITSTAIIDAATQIFAQAGGAEVTTEADADTEEETEASDQNPAVGIAELTEEEESVTEAAQVVEEETEEAESEEPEEVGESVAESVEVGAGEEETEADAEETADIEGETFNVGIVQFVSHASLDQIETAIEAELDVLADETGAQINYTLYNGEADASTLTQIATQLISDEVDVMVAIATPAAQILQAQDEDAQIPIVFAAVTDPEGAGLVASNEEPGSFITGTSDALNTETMMNLIIANDPEIEKVGLLYSNSEDSSNVPIQEAKDFLEEQGIEYVEKTGTTTDEVSQAVDALIADGVGAIFTPTDNTIMSAELSIYEKLQEAGIPHYCGADSFALNGAYLGFGVNYVDLGTVTADIVVDILAGADTATYPVATFDNGIATINVETADALGYDLDEKKEAFAPYCTEIIETATAENFE